MRIDEFLDRIVNIVNQNKAEIGLDFVSDKTEFDESLKGVKAFGLFDIDFTQMTEDEPYLEYGLIGQFVLVRGDDFKSDRSRAVDMVEVLRDLFDEDAYRPEIERVEYYRAMIGEVDVYVAELKIKLGEVAND